MSDATPLNPYAAPVQTSESAGPAEACYRDGDLLLVRPGAILPPFCPFTGQAAEASWKQSTMRISWMPRWVRPVTFVVVFACVFFVLSTKGRFAAIPHLNVAFFTLAASILIRSQRKRGKLQCYMTPSIRRSRLLMMVPGYILMWAGVTLLYLHIAGAAGIVTSEWMRLGLLLSGVLLVRATKRLTAVSCQAGWFHLKGCAAEFLDQLPAANATRY